MQYRHFDKLNLKPSLLGFGVMRLPTITNGDSTVVDQDEAVKMIRYAIDHGVNYIDTAWPYHNGESEIVTGIALQDGYREKVMLATKNPSWLIEKAEDWDEYLDKQLEKLKTDHIDFYLQHCLDKENYDKFKRFNLWERAMAAKKAGKIKYFGFSFHDEQDLFMEILDAYDWDFCQIQLNYLDTEYQAGLAGLERAAQKNMGVIIMEPLRGGFLVNGIPQDLRQRMDEHPAQYRPVEWGLRYLANRPEVSVILSGMSTMEQVKDNIALCSAEDMVPNHLSQDKLDFIADIAQCWHNKKHIGCTACRYCMPCPQGVNIPECFKHYNYFHSANVNAERTARERYKELIDTHEDASQCVECGACEAACPQHLPIIETLSNLHKELAQK
jgi:predicted aldo/keto reductase-like oxidoreductase